MKKKTLKYLAIFVAAAIILLTLPSMLVSPIVVNPVEGLYVLKGLPYLSDPQIELAVPALELPVPMHTSSQQNIYVLYLVSGEHQWLLEDLELIGERVRVHHNGAYEYADLNGNTFIEITVISIEVIPYPTPSPYPTPTGSPYPTPTPTPYPTPTPTPHPTPSPSGLVFKTDFEDATWKNNDQINLKNQLNQYYMHTWILRSSGDIFIDDGTARSNSPTPHSGSRMIGGEFTSSSSGTKRAQLDIKFQRDSNDNSAYPPGGWIDDRYYLRVWYYFSPDWALRNSGYNWASLCTIHNNEHGEISHQFVLTVRTFRNPPSDAYNDYKLCIGAPGESHTGGPVETTPSTWNVANIRGRWNLLEIYVRRGPTSVNWCTVWWDGVKILDAGGFPSLDYTDDWFISLPKVYSDTSGINRQWIDDLEIYDMMPW